MSTGTEKLWRRHIAPSFLGWSALSRIGLVCVILVALWLIVAWAVALP